MAIVDNSNFLPPQAVAERESRDMEDVIEMSTEEADLVDGSMEMESSVD